ncbi:hypothetical protein FRC12_018155 [Ceratobasidium sp. 428]|nr:hypothetical protein FRC12_018155 [Ceratobasidium sp. 428]
MSKGPHFIGVEYEGRKVAVRGSANYDVTVSSVKKAFKALRSVEADRISLTAFLEDLGGIYEISEELWPTILPDLKQVVVVLDSSSRSAERDPSPTPSDFPVETPSDFSIEIPSDFFIETASNTSSPGPAEHKPYLTVKDSFDEIDIMEQYKMPKPKTALPHGKETSTTTVPHQPEIWDEVPSHNTILAIYRKKGVSQPLRRKIILTSPQTTIPDLKDFILLWKPEDIGPKAQFEFKCVGSSRRLSKNKRTVADLEFDQLGGVFNVYITE